MKTRSQPKRAPTILRFRTWCYLTLRTLLDKAPNPDKRETDDKRETVQSLDELLGGGVIFTTVSEPVRAWSEGGADRCFLTVHGTRSELTIEELNEFKVAFFAGDADTCVRMLGELLLQPHSRSPEISACPHCGKQSKSEPL